MSAGLVIGVLGFLLWWGGYYAALVIAWRAGARQVGLFALAAVLGLCGCFGIPLLGFFWTEVQKRTFAAIEELPDDAPTPRHTSHYKLAAAVAVVGLVMQILGGNLLPEDDGYSYEEPDSGYVYEPVVDYEPPVDADETAFADEDDDERWGEWEDPAPDEDELAEEALAADTLDEETLEPAEPEVATMQGILLGLGRDRRAAAVFVDGRVEVARRAAGRWPVSLLPCTRVALEGEWVERVFQVTQTSPLEGDGCEGLPRPEVVRSFDAPLTTLAGRYVLLPAPHAETTTSLRFTEELTLTVRAPRNAITRDTDYTAVRGVLVDTSALQPRGGLELWVLRAGDLVGL